MPENHERPNHDRVDPTYPTPVHQREHRPPMHGRALPENTLNPQNGAFVSPQEVQGFRQPDGNENYDWCLAGAVQLPPGNRNPLNVPPANGGELKGQNHGGNVSRS